MVILTTIAPPEGGSHVTTYTDGGNPLPTSMNVYAHRILVTKIPGHGNEAGAFNVGRNPIFPDGNPIGYYIGQVCQEDTGTDHKYRALVEMTILGVKKVLVVDSEKFRGWASYINGSSEAEANVRYYTETNDLEVLDQRCYHVWIVPIKPILPGEQFRVCYGNMYAIPSDALALHRMSSEEVHHALCKADVF